jgi:hypothetical protein
LKRVRIAIPCYDSKVYAYTSNALLTEMIPLLQHGWDLDFSFVPGSSLVHIARDKIANEFMDSDAERLVFIDSDVSWKPGSIVQLLSHDVDFVGGAYRHKRDDESYPVQFHPGETRSDPETGLMDVQLVPGGFMAVTKKVFQSLRKRFKQRKEYTIPFGPKQWPYFHCPPGEGEDRTFCDEWRESGGKIYLDPHLTLAHHDGVKTYMGCIREWAERTDCGRKKF